MSASAERLQRLHELHPSEISLELDRVYRLLENLGHPERRLPPVVHIAGTNGKGSTLAFLKSILKEAGYSVQVYSSPHLVDFKERIELSRGLISEGQLCFALDQVLDANDGEPLTFFEGTTVAALLAFANDPADVLLLETGLGGRLDATNVVEQPALTIITPISKDHEAFLGSEIAGIARQKAGIIKPNVPLLLAQQVEEARNVIRERAFTLEAPVWQEGEEWHVEFEDDRSILVDLGDRSYSIGDLALLGDHQIQNAAVAIVAADYMTGATIDQDFVDKGLNNAAWPARLQDISQSDYGAALPKGWRLILDGGHNVAAAETISAWLEKQADSPVHMVLGMLSNRDPAEFLAAFEGQLQGLHLMSIPDEPNAHTALDLFNQVPQGAAEEIGLAGSLTSALRSIADRTSSDKGTVIICGSLYLAGTVLSGRA